MIRNIFYFLLLSFMCITFLGSEEYTHPTGKFINKGNNKWIEADKSGKHFASFKEKGRKDGYIFLIDRSRNMSVRLPVEGGTAHWGKIKGFKDWYAMYEVKKDGSQPESDDGRKSEEVSESKEEPESINSSSDMSSEMVSVHNKYRKTVGSPSVTWDSNMASYAQEWADYLKDRKCSMEHRPRSGKYTQKYGENIAWASGMNLTPDSVVKMWYDEVKDYKYDSNSCNSGKVCGHYTQVVWKKSSKIGCAKAICGRTQVWVCNYDPPGNYVGQKPY